MKGFQHGDVIISQKHNLIFSIFARCQSLTLASALPLNLAEQKDQVCSR